MNFTTSRWNLLYFAIGLDIYTTITWKHWCQQRYITENCDIWTTPLLKDYQVTGNVHSFKVAFAWRNIFHLMPNVHHSNSCQFVLLNDRPVALRQSCNFKPKALPNEFLKKQTNRKSKHALHTNYTVRWCSSFHILQLFEFTVHNDILCNPFSYTFVYSRCVDWIQQISESPHCFLLRQSCVVHISICISVNLFKYQNLRKCVKCI